MLFSIQKGPIMKNICSHAETEHRPCQNVEHLATAHSNRAELHSLTNGGKKKKLHKHCKNVWQFSQQAWEPLSMCKRVWTLTRILLRVHDCTGGSRTCAHWCLHRESCWFWLSLHEKRKRKSRRGMINNFITDSSWPLFFAKWAQVSSGTNTYDQGHVNSKIKRIFNHFMQYRSTGS